MSSKTNSADKPLNMIVFPSELGWMGIVHCGNTILRTTFAHPTRHQAMDKLSPLESTPVKPRQSQRRWIEQFQRYAAGCRVSMRKFQIDQTWMTPFQRKVVELCRTIQYGKTLSYGQLARLAGSPGASRAVGSTMAKNRYPLIVPCHRVVGANGIGGFSAPDGLNFKRRLLQLEGAKIAS